LIFLALLKMLLMPNLWISFGVENKLKDE